MPRRRKPADGDDVACGCGDEWSRDFVHLYEGRAGISSGELPGYSGARAGDDLDADLRAAALADLEEAVELTSLNETGSLEPRGNTMAVTVDGGSSAEAKLLSQGFRPIEQYLDEGNQLKVVMAAQRIDRVLELEKRIVELEQSVSLLGELLQKGAEESLS